MNAAEITTVLSDADKAALWGWGDDIFRTRALNLEWRPKEWHMILRERGRAVSKVSLLRHTVRVGRTALDVGGVGGVVTVPEAQHRGLARRLMGEAQSFLRDELHLDFGVLFCLDFMLPFYRSLEWTEVASETVIRQSDGIHVLPRELHAMHLPLAARAWPEGNLDLESLPW